MKRYSIVTTHRFDQRIAEVEEFGRRTLGKEFLAVRSESRAVSVAAEIMRSVAKLRCRVAGG